MIARLASPGPGNGTSYAAPGPSSIQAITLSSPSYRGLGAPSPRMQRSTASIASLPAWAGANAFQLLMAPLRDWRVVKLTWAACCTAW